MNKKKIMVVEDAEEVNLFVTKVLKDNGYETMSVYNAEDCLKEIKKFRPDLVILDIELPGKSGLDICDAIYTMVEVPVVFLTNKSDEKTLDKIMVSKTKYYIIKPVDADELLEWVSIAIESNSFDS